MGNNRNIHVFRIPFLTVRFLIRRLRFRKGPSSLVNKKSKLAILGLAWDFFFKGSRDRGCLLSNALINSVAFSKSLKPCHLSCFLFYFFYRTKYCGSYLLLIKIHFFRIILFTSHSLLDSSSFSIASLKSIIKN
jgi:hypothetical protein